MGDLSMGATKIVKNVWGDLRGWVKNIIMSLVGLLVISTCSYIVNRAISAPSASEVNSMIDLKIGASPLMTRGAQSALNQLILDNSIEHMALQKDLDVIQNDTRDIKNMLYDLDRSRQKK